MACISPNGSLQAERGSHGVICPNPACYSQLGILLDLTSGWVFVFYLGLESSVSRVALSPDLWSRGVFVTWVMTSLGWRAWAASAMEAVYAKPRILLAASNRSTPTKSQIPAAVCRQSGCIRPLRPNKAKPNQVGALPGCAAPF